MILEERKAQELIRLRGYRLLKREEQKGVVSFVAEMPREGKRVVVWCVPAQATVGVRFVNQLKKIMETEGAEKGILIAGDRYSYSAKVLAKKRGIELIPRFFPSFNIFDHVLVPKHEILTQKEREEILAQYRVQPHQLPWIRASDPAVRAIGAKPGDIVRIIRDSPTAGKYVSYRYVI
jgi:DNA-directed RNA polymerase subunit H